MKTIPEIIGEHSSGPSVNIEGIIRDLGIQLDKKTELPEQVSGRIERLDNGEYKILANAKEWYYRQRFTMAHELGHYVLHKDRLGEGTDDSIAYRSVQGSKFFNQRISPTEEAQANAFAAEILMPVHLVKQAMEECNGDQKAAAKRIQTSEGALKIRLASLENSGQYKTTKPS